MLDRLKRSVESSPVVRINSYEYSVSPITDGVPWMEPELLEEITDHIIQIANLDCDLIVAPEAMGIPIAVSLSLRTGIPYNVVRKRRYGLPGEISISQLTSYSKSQMYINGLKSGDRVVLVDDVISTGNTTGAVIEALKQAGVEIVDVVIVLERGEGRETIERRTGQHIKTLMRAEVRGGRTVASIRQGEQM
ncbi:MAG: purine phosphoribosyltransferase family protein [Euryarchaeota archaeon]|nr:purine phosphoribosyltransferase family protein [Euryarchaeota archaeon]